MNAEQQAEVIRLHNDGVSEGEITRRLELTRHAVRSVTVYEDGRRAGIREEAARHAAEVAERVSHIPAALMEQVTTGTGAALQLPALNAGTAPGDSPYDEALMAEITGYIKEGKPVPERELRAKHHLSSTIMYKYRAVAADRVLWGRR